MAVVFSKKRGVPPVLQGRYADDPAQPPSPADVVVDPSGRVVPFRPDTDDDPSTPEVYMEPAVSSALVSGGSIARKTASSTLLIPFFGYLVLTDRLPGWARLFAGLAGAGLLMQRMGGDDGVSSYAGCGCGCNGAPGGCQG